MLVPLFSLLISLPSMLSARLETAFPERLPTGTPMAAQLDCSTRPFMLHWSCRILVKHAITGRTWRLRNGDSLPTEHCGVLHCYMTRARVYDLLGLFAVPLRCQKEHRVVVEPHPLPMELEEDADSIPAWKPKNGGFSEYHELRLYAPGDSLRQIHWKLTAKTGKLIIREPMQPDPGTVWLRLELKGNDRERERLLGRALWLGQQLLLKQIPFRLFCLTGNGVEQFPADSPRSFQQAMDGLLGSPLAQEGSLPEEWAPDTMQYTLGGEPDEI